VGSAKRLLSSVTVSSNFTPNASSKLDASSVGNLSYRASVVNDVTSGITFVLILTSFTVLGSGGLFITSTPESARDLLCSLLTMSQNASDAGRAYHTQCTGDALETVRAHENDQDITLFASCFCPFVQRVWVAFEVLGIPYKVHYP